MWDSTESKRARKAEQRLLGSAPHHADGATHGQDDAHKLLQGAGLQVEHDCYHGGENRDCGLHAGGHHHARHVYADNVEELIKVQAQAQAQHPPQVLPLRQQPCARATTWRSLLLPSGCS